MRNRDQRSGYVLVMVMALLVISATLLVAVGRAAGRSAMAARAARDDLQKRWGVASCEKAVLPHVEQILSALEQERHRPVGNFSVSVKMGGETFEMMLADEQAKANVNAILEYADASRGQTRIRLGLAGSGLANKIKLRPMLGPVIELIDKEASTRPVAATLPAGDPANRLLTLSVGGWGQVFDGVAPGQLIRPMPGGKRAPLDLLTLWGNGAVNVRRATDSAMAMAAGGSVTGVQIGRLIDARKAIYAKHVENLSGESPGDKLKDLMVKTAGASLANKGNLGLVEGSKCHSLWVISRRGGREGYDLFVLDETKEQRPVVWAYSW